MSMKLLVLGGTVFLGRVMVEQALARGWEVTLFNRGKSGADVFPDVETIIGDRKENLDALKGRTWDAVIDTSGYLPGDVRATAEALADSVKHYTFISSISVYKDHGTKDTDESYGLEPMPEGATVDEFKMEAYGALKALCEQAAEEAMPGRVLHVRAGFIVGRYDRTDRFTYWPVRTQQGGEMLAPYDRELPLQFIDVRDLADWNLDMIEQNVTGVFNVTGKPAGVALGDLIDAGKTVSGQDTAVIWLPEAFLVENELLDFQSFPLAISPDNPDFGGMMFSNIDKALASGLTFRPLEDTVKDTLQWANSRGDDYEPRTGLKPERETELLAKWKSQVTEA